MPTLETTVTYDDRDLLVALKQAEDALSDLTPELGQVAKVLTARIDRNFLNAKSLYDPLAESTKENRRRMRRRGRKLVAGDDDPLRVSDTLRKAATATQAGVTGSAFQVSKTSVTVGVKEPQEGVLPYGRAVLLGRKVPTPVIPSRNAIEVGETEIREARGIIERGVENKMARLFRGV